MTRATPIATSGAAPRSAVIVDAVRTPLGLRNGLLKNWHPVDLAALTLRAIVERNELDPAVVDDVIIGCVTQVGEQAGNLARNATLAAGFPASVPATTVDRQCGSGQQAVHFAAQGVMAGAYDVVIAAGVEVMSRVPIGAAVATGPGSPFSRSVLARYADAGGLQPLGVLAELIAERWAISRDDCDEYASRSIERAAQAASAGRFDLEVVAVEIKTARGTESLRVDEAVRRTLSARPDTAERLARLKPAFRTGGRITSGNSAPIADGSAAVLIMSEAAAQRLGTRPMARFHTFAVTGVDPNAAPAGAIDATTCVLQRAHLAIGDIDRCEIDEAFAAAALAWNRAHKVDPDRVNVNGGAIALGHPLGCSGARMLTTLVHDLVRNGGRFGLQAMSEAGGTANAAIIERF